MLIEINGVKINYELEGKEGNPCLTFSNSLAANLNMWDPQAEYFKENYRILRYDTRGHGQSEAAEPPYSLETLADDVVGLWAQLGINKSHFIGLSLGGMIGQGLALRYPDKLLSLAVCDSRADCPEQYRNNWHQRIPEVEKNGMDPLVEPTITRWFTEDCINARPEMMDEVRQMVGATSKEGYIGCAQAILGLNYLDSLDTIELPSIFIVGAQDTGTPPEAAKAMHEKVSGSIYQEIDPAAHVSNMENPTAFNKALENFLENIEKDT